MSDAHAVGAWVVIVANAVVAVWALVVHARPGAPRRGLWPATAAAQVAVLAEVGLGVWLQSVEGIEEPQGFHAAYGFAAFASVGLLYAYRNEMKGRLTLLYGLGGLWLMGLGIRAVLLSS